MSREIFVNLPVRGLPRSMDFFKSLSFSFNPQFTDEKPRGWSSALLSEPFFRGFTRNEICDTTRATEALLALSCSSKAAVDQMVRKAIDAGGCHAMDPTDHGFMYAWSFYDVDGHHWEVLWMDAGAVQ